MGYVVGPIIVLDFMVDFTADVRAIASLGSGTVRRAAALGLGTGAGGRAPIRPSHRADTRRHRPQGPLDPRLRPLGCRRPRPTPPSGFAFGPG